MNKHKLVSFIKSGVRIIGFFLLVFSIPWGVAILLIAEILGIIEEM